MKAKVKETGCVYDFIKIDHMNFRRKSDGEIYCGSEIDFIDDCAQDDPDYWTRLEHQYAGMAMQGLCANYTEFTKDNDGTLSNTEMIVENARLIAHTLVEMYKKEEEK